MLLPAINLCPKDDCKIMLPPLAPISIFEAAVIGKF